MKQASVCVKCKTWEEDFYWKHFSCMHFFVFLPNDFHQHLVLPAKFAEKMMHKLPDKVSLIGPSGAVWDIELKKTDNIEFGGDGWIQFVKAHNLEEKNLLVFKYKKKLSFEVLIFNLENFCEKESSYFVNLCMHENAEYGNEKKRTITESFSVEVIENDGVDCVVSKKLGDCVAEEPETSKSLRIMKKSIARAPQVRTRPMKRLRSCESKRKSMALSEKEPHADRTEDGAAPHENRDARKLGNVSSGEKNAVEDEDLHELVEKEPHENQATSELSNVLECDQITRENDQITRENDQITQENGGSILETAHSRKCTERKNRAKKLVAAKSSKKLEYHIAKEPDEDQLAHNTAEEATEENGAARDRLDVSEIDKNTKEEGRKTAHSQKPTEKKGSVEKCSSNYKSNRRPVTNIEKEMALKMALLKVKAKSFVVMMRPTAVYRRFYLNVPNRWISKHLPPRSQRVVLRMGEKTWEVLFYFYRRKAGGITGYGWKKFVLDNHLEEFDVCLITLATNKDDFQAIMDVEIFRVIPEIVPPSPASPRLA